MVLDKVNNPVDLKKLNNEELIKLCDEIKELLLKKVSLKGGHLGSNLAIVEITTALHYVFNSPIDKFVFDVSHQTYPHKILTGRKEAFIDEAHYSDVTGFSSINEKPYDNFTMGHTSTSISLGLGLAKARDMLGKKYNVVSVIGDGSLSGGEAFEGLNNISKLNSNAIVIVNDNKMSMCENFGSLYDNLKELRDSKGSSSNNIFKALGFDYYYLEDGNDVLKCIELFKRIKDVNHPVLLHISTTKGYGYEPAIKEKYLFHSCGPFDLETGEFKNKGDQETYITIIQDFLIDEVKRNDKVMALSAAAPFFYGLKSKRSALGKNLYDSGISEPTIMTMASALALEGLSPFVSMYSYFVHRTYDQLNQDIALNNAKVNILVHNGTVGNIHNGVGASATHVGVFDIPLISNIPNFVYLSPVYKEELLRILELCANSKFNNPVAIRVPTIDVLSLGIEDKTDYTILNKYKVINKGSKVALIGAGNFFPLMKELKEKLEEIGISATLINPIYLSGIDKELLDELKLDHELVITAEDGIIEGGFGAKISQYYSKDDIKVINYGLKKQFYDYPIFKDVVKENHLSIELMIDDIKKILKV